MLEYLIAPLRPACSITPTPNGYKGAVAHGTLLRYAKWSAAGEDIVNEREFPLSIVALCHHPYVLLADSTLYDQQASYARTQWAFVAG
jgi:hypothetical protein